MLTVPAAYSPGETTRHRVEPAFTDEFWTDHPEVGDQALATAT